MKSIASLLSIIALGFGLLGCPDGGGGGGSTAAFAVSTTAADFGVVGNPYASTLAATGGTAPLTWTVSGGVLPTGLSLDAGTGVVSSMPGPTAAGNFTVVFTVTDSTGKTATGSVLFAIHTRTDRVSVDSSGTAGNGVSSTPSINSDGSLVAFVSQSTNFVTGVNGFQIYVHNRRTNQVEVISRDNNTTTVNEGDGVSSDPAISGDGRFVVFVSQSTNLVTGVSGQQVYLRDRQTVQTTLISKSSSGATSNGLVNSSPAISGDGQFIAFVSNATNLVAGVSGQQIYLHDRATATTTLISKDNSPVPVAGNGNSATPSISSTGQFVAFTSLATNLGAVGGTQQIYIHDRLAGANATSLISKDGSATAGNGNSSTPSVSGDGQFIAFASVATNLVTGVSGGQIYLHDRNTGVNGTNSIVSHDNNGVPVQGNGGSTLPSISSNGQVISFASLATNLLNPAPAVTGQQIYSHDRLAGASGTTSLVSKDNSVIPIAGDFASDQPSANSTGAFMAFSSQATNLVAGSGFHIYVRAMP